MVPEIPCVSGFISNGVAGRMDIAESATSGVQGSATGYFLLGSKSNRSVYSPASAAAEAAVRKEQQRGRTASKGASLTGDRAPRSGDGELILNEPRYLLSRRLDG